MSRRKSRKIRQTRSQRILWFLSLVLVGSMVLSLFIFALPTGPATAPEISPSATETEQPSRTATPGSEVTPDSTAPTLTPVVSPTSLGTEPVMGPVLPTEMPALSPTVTATPTVAVTPTVTPTVTPSPTAVDLGLSFAVCGDSRGNPTVYSRVLQAVATDGSEFLVHLGDLVNVGTEAQWLEFRKAMEAFPLPFHPVPGNHDALDGRLEGFLAYSGAQAVHYSFDRQSVHLTMVDSHNGGVTAAEMEWLRDDLSASTLPVKMVFLHHPPFDPDGTDHIMAFGTKRFIRLMIEQGVGYVFAGHIHAYAQEERDGVVYTITGGAGAPLYSSDHPQAFYHYLRVKVQGEDVTVEVVKI